MSDHVPEAVNSDVTSIANHKVGVFSPAKLADLHIAGMQGNILLEILLLPSTFKLGYMFSDVVITSIKGCFKPDTAEVWHI